MGEESRIRRRIFKVHLSEYEYEILTQKSEYCNVNRSEFIRKLIMDGSIIKYETCDLKKMIFEINHIGTNINQIAKKVNETECFDKKDFELLQDLYNELFNNYILFAGSGEQNGIY